MTALHRILRPPLLTIFLSIYPPCNYLAGIPVGRDQAVKTEGEVLLAVEAPPLAPGAARQVPGPPGPPDGLLLVPSVLLHHPPVLLLTAGSALASLLRISALCLD